MGVGWGGGGGGGARCVSAAERMRLYTICVADTKE